MVDIVGYANEMLNGIKEFTQQRPHTSVMRVKIVADKLDLLRPIVYALTATEDDRSTTPLFSANHRKNAFTSNNLYL